MQYTIETICQVISGRFLQYVHPASISRLVTDSRQVFTAADSLFFALKGPRRNGHQFIGMVYHNGLRNFIVDESIDIAHFPEANFILVQDVLEALQQLAAWHRRQFRFPVIGITGSNGKTIVKEWIYQLLQEDFSIVRSPKSYNSQLGVPLSVWQMDKAHTLGIFEAGISTMDEMQHLENIIKPGIGIFTTIGEAHSEGFENIDLKVKEKLKLFRDVQVLIYCSDHQVIERQVSKLPLQVFNWGHHENAQFRIIDTAVTHASTKITGLYNGQGLSFTIPFTDNASLENAITCYCTLLYLGLSPHIIAHRMQQLLPVNMRLEYKKGIHNCTLINDSYSADLSSLQIALHFLQQQAGGAAKTVILSDFSQSALPDAKLYEEIATLLLQYGVSKVYAIGEHISRHLRFESPEQAPRIYFFNNIDEFRQQFRATGFRDEFILIKGARSFRLEQVSRMLEQKLHQTMLEINLTALLSNIKTFQQQLDSHTRIMAMVKAFAYGSGGAEIATALQTQKVDYLGVAYADEGVALRTAGIHLPIMVLNVEESSFEAVIAHQLEPVIYSFPLLKSFGDYIKSQGMQQFPVHIEIETGMHRLGFAQDEWPQLAERLAEAPLKVQSVFSHLAAGEDPAEDSFTLRQHSIFSEACRVLQASWQYPFLQHIANSAAAARHPLLQMDMVRLGIGMYGVNSSKENSLQLRPVAALKTTIAQLKKVPAGETVSYNRKGLVTTDALIATVRIGYADGYPRMPVQMQAYMLVHGERAPVVGTVCMDMTMIDVTGIPHVKEGDEVVVFGKGLPVEQLAEWASTIPYEIMTGISERVQRVYYEE